MVTGAAFQTLAGQARRLYIEELVKGLAGVVQDGGQAIVGAITPGGRSDAK